MLISESKRFVFVHVSKSGGSTINLLLRPYALPRTHSLWRSIQRPFRMPRDHRKFSFPKHAGLSVAQRQLPEELYDECFKFAFVRNPWDRLVSEYSALLLKPHHRRYKRVASRDFKHYVMQEAPRIVSRQATQLTDLKGRIGLDFIGRFERFAEDAEYLCDRFDIPFPLDIPTTNKSAHEHYRDYYDHQTRNFVAQHWARDVECFDYAF